MERKIYDICIIGGGASGLACAAEAGKLMPGISMFIVEKNDVPGRKILSTGNGRCNLSNVKCPGHEEVLKFFSTLGIMTRTDDAGRIYPYSEDARDVAEALTGAAIQSGAEIMTGAVCTACSFDEKELLYETQVTVKGNSGAEERSFSVSSRAVVIAAGGKAAPKLGTTGDGYRLARGFYHSVTTLAPALTAVETHEDLSALSGVRAKVRLSLIVHGGSIFEEDGEIQFTDYGISGICVFNMSRFMVIPEGRTLINGFDDYAAEIDFLPDVKDAESIVKERFDDMPDGTLRSVVKKPVAEMILDRTGRDPEMTAWMLKHFMVHPSGLRGWDHAEITRGGVPLNEIKMDRMESKYFPGLFFTGEIIDFDGPCGGFNLENAWETGIRAARAIASDMKNRAGTPAEDDGRQQEE